MPIKETPVARVEPAENRIAVGRPRQQKVELDQHDFQIVQETVQKMQASEEDKAKYRMEVMFSRHRSSLPHKSSPAMVLIWESGKRFHGGGDQKMYWCGYRDCIQPLSADLFAYMHCVCPACGREQFLDPDSKALHIQSLRSEGRSSQEIERMPTVWGEKCVHLPPPKLAELLEKTFYELQMDADLYIKFSPYEIRYDALHETTADMDKLEKARVQRKPVIYLLKAIRKDIATGANLHARFLAMVTA